MYTQKLLLSYDLGIDGDYMKLYKWLDANKALECGDSVCMINYNFTTITQICSEDDTRKALKEIYNSLKRAEIEFRLNDRIYVASDFYWQGTKSLKGGFIVGKRKPNPWDGFAGTGEGNFEVE